jgi:hypothetical protein
MWFESVIEAYSLSHPKAEVAWREAYEQSQLGNDSEELEQEEDEREDSTEE